MQEVRATVGAAFAWLCGRCGTHASASSLLSISRGPRPVAADYSLYVNLYDVPASSLLSALFSIVRVTPKTKKKTQTISTPRILNKR